MAREGVLFTQFYANSPVCSPTRVALLTGRFPSPLGIHAHISRTELNRARGMPDALDASVPTLAKLLKAKGYATGHFGKWHLGHLPTQNYGFDASKTFVGGGEPGWDNRSLEFIQRSSELIVDEALRFVEAHRDRPFFVNVWFKDVHAPLAPTEEQMKPYQRLRPRGEWAQSFTAPAQVFYAAVTEMDRQVGRLLRRLDEWGLGESTLVIFTSDNGPEDWHIRNAAHSGVGSPGPFRGRKRSLYEGGIRVPFIVRWKGTTPAGRVDETTVISGVDLLPTFCALAGIDWPEDMKLDGEDMSDALRGQPKQRTRPLFWEFRGRIFGHPLNRSPMLAIREGRWKLLMNPDESRIELYDLLNDPMEVDNVAGQQPEVVRSLARRLKAWHDSMPPRPKHPQAGSHAYPWPKRP
jgi:N-acetylgalactosamine-6-sulfatase